MSITVSAAARDTMLTTVANVQSRLGPITATSEATLIGSLLRSSGRAIAMFIGREIARQTYIETLWGNDRRRLSLARFPLDRNSVTLTINDTAETDFTVEVPTTGMLWRENNWSSINRTTGQDGEENVAVTYKAGYVLPNWIAAWTTGAIKVVGDWVQVKIGSTPVKDFLFECTTAGTTDATTQPVWPTTAAGTVTDGTVVWTARHALKLPEDIEEAALLTASAWFNGGLDVMPHVARERMGDMWMEYFAPKFAEPNALPRAAQFLLEAYR